jgi:hypothetical protein
MLRLTSGPSELFLQQPASEQRRLLQTVVEKAAWKDGALEAALFDTRTKKVIERKRRRRGPVANWKSGSSGRIRNLQPFG